MYNIVYSMVSKAVRRVAIGVVLFSSVLDLDPGTISNIIRLPFYKDGLILGITRRLILLVPFRLKVERGVGAGVEKDKSSSPGPSFPKKRSSILVFLFVFCRGRWESGQGEEDAYSSF